MYSFFEQKAKLLLITIEGLFLKTFYAEDAPWMLKWSLKKALLPMALTNGLSELGHLLYDGSCFDTLRKFS